MACLSSRPYQTADPGQHCERCVFGTGEHADHCPEYIMARLTAARARMVIFNAQRAKQPAKLIRDIQSMIRGITCRL